jgi:hypothetical protein
MDFGASRGPPTEGRTNVDRPSRCFGSTRDTPERQPRRLEMSHHLVTSESAECPMSPGNGPVHKPDHTDDPRVVASVTKFQSSGVCREHRVPSSSTESNDAAKWQMLFADGSEAGR